VRIWIGAVLWLLAGLLMSSILWHAWECPACGASLSIALTPTRFCGKCGVSIPPGEHRGFFCPRCGRLPYGSWTIGFCRNCGRRLRAK
jgi:ribosomal protein S27AE